MTVREAFSKAFGEVPQDATCHIGCWRMTPDSYDEEGNQVRVQLVEPCFTKMKLLNHVPVNHVGRWNSHALSGQVIGQDISEQPASAFRGFFGKEYDQVLDEAGL